MNEFRLKNYIFPQKKYFIGSQVAIAFETLLDLQMPLIVAILMDKGVLLGDFTVITNYSIIYILLLVINAFTLFAFGYCSAHASNKMAADIRSKTFAHINKLKLADMQNITAGALITRLTSDINIIQESTNLMLRLVLRAPLQLVGGILMLLFLDNRFALLLSFAIIVLLIIISAVVKRTQPLYKNIQNGLDDLNVVNQEGVVGLRTIKAYLGEEVEEERFNSKNNEVAKAVFQVQRLVSIMQPAFGIVMNLTLGALLIIAFITVDSSSLQIGQIMAAVSYITQILFALIMLVMIFPSLSRASISLQRVKEVFALSVEVEEHNKEKLEEIKSIEFLNVSFTYPQIKEDIEENTKKNLLQKNNNSASIQNINFKINKGDRIAFLGTTGAGKSTIIKILFGLYEANEGKVLINGKDIRDYSLSDIRNAISYVLQKSDLFNASILENITFSDLNYTQQHVERATKIAQADDFIMKLEGNYEKELGSKGVGVSGGQKQRINLSRAFLKESSLLILDDCTSALDLITEKKVHQAIKEADMYSSILLISQKVVSVQDMDRIYLLDKGRIVDFGSHKELVKKSALYRDFCKSQNFIIKENNHE